MNRTNQWNAALYDDKMSFVSHYGKGLVEWLHPVSGERILDLGCGTGDLSAQLAEAAISRKETTNSRRKAGNPK